MNEYLDLGLITSFVPAASSFAGEIDFLFDLVTLIIGFWFILTLATLFYILLRFKKKDGIKAQYITGEKHSEKVWTHYPHYAVILFDVVLIGFVIVVWVQVKQTLPANDDIIRAIGQQWSWSFIHSGKDGVLDTNDDVNTVNDLHVIKDKIYHFELQSRDVIHNFAVNAFRLRQDTIPGRTIKGWFKPTKDGTFDLLCAEICGRGHSMMMAAITVHPDQKSYNETMISIQNGTYQSHFQLKREKGPVPLPFTLKNKNKKSPYAIKLAKSF
jgi:cytochrome c oxidase subunit 2